MAIGSGLAASLGLAAETTYGTYVAPTRFHEFTSEDLKKIKNVVQGGGLAAGRLAQAGSRRVVTTNAGSGSISMEVPNKGFGLLLQHLMGTTVTPVQQGATAAYLQTHTIADNVGKYLTGQVGVPATSGTVNPYTFLGGKVTGAEFSCGVDELLMAKIDMDYRQVVESQSLAAPSYTASVSPFHGGQMDVKLGTYNSEASVSGVKKVTVQIERAQNTSRFYAGGSGLKSEPIMSDFIKVSGTFEVDYLDKTTFADRFAADTSTALDLVFTGDQIAAPYNYTFRLRLPQIFLDGDTPTVDGPDVVSGSFPFVAQYDGTNALATILYTSTDTTV